MELSQLKKGALSKLFTLISFGLLATSVIVFVLPVVSGMYGNVLNLLNVNQVDRQCFSQDNIRPKSVCQFSKSERHRSVVSVMIISVISGHVYDFNDKFAQVIIG